MTRGFEVYGEKDAGSRNTLATKVRNRPSDGRLVGSEVRLVCSGTTRYSYTMLRSSGGLGVVSGVNFGDCGVGRTDKLKNGDCAWLCGAFFEVRRV